MTDLRQSGSPPPSPHWKGPLEAADVVVLPSSYGATRLRPDARSLAVPGLLAMVLLGIQICGLVIIAVGVIVNRSFWSEYRELLPRRRYDDWLLDALGRDAFDLMLRRYSDVIGVGAGVATMVVIAAFLFVPTFVWWFQRAYRNVMVRDLSAAWAVAGFFVPVVNLWKPKQIANRIWRASVSSQLGACVQWWWFGGYVLLLMYPVYWVLLRLAASSEDFEAIGVVGGLAVLLGASIPIALLRMIRSVTRAQEPLVTAAQFKADMDDAHGKRDHLSLVQG